MSLPEGRVDDTPRRRTPGDLVRAFAPPLRSPRFWVLQLMVFAIGALHDLLLVWLRDRDATLAVPPPVTSALFFIPVLYAALSFGVEGGVGTALLSTALLVPHWFLPDAMTPMHVWMEGGNLLVLNAVAVIVGKRVEHERRDRMRAERARGLAEMATSRYHALFGNHPSPVIITTASGRITETNEAAMRVFGDATTGRDLASLLGISLQALIDGSPRLEITTIEGEERLFVPDAHAISVGMSAELVQVCLVDITEQQRRQDEQRMFGVRLLAGGGAASDREGTPRRPAADTHVLVPGTRRRRGRRATPRRAPVPDRRTRGAGG